MLLYAYFTPKVDFKRKFNPPPIVSLQRGRFENFESDHQYESNLESDVRFEIESNHEASQVLKIHSNFVSKIHFLRYSPLNEKCHDLETWGYASFEVIRNDTIRYDLLTW